MSSPGNNTEKTPEPRGSLFLVVGPSGVGKNTLIHKAIEQDLRARYIPSLSTRKMRVSEAQGKPYRFISKEEFLAEIEGDQLLEWEEVNGFYYGSSIHDIEACLSEGLDAITDMDVFGAHNLLLKLPVEVCTIFVMVSSQEQLKRITSRNVEGQENLRRRLERTGIETDLSVLFDYLVYNDQLEDSVDQVLSIMKAHRTKRRLIEFAEERGSLYEQRVLEFSAICTGDDSQEPPFELPRTAVGDFEGLDHAFARLIRMISYKSELDLSPKDFLIVSQKERQPSNQGHQSYIQSVLKVTVETAQVDSFLRLEEAVRLYK
jgi:guanylate kinase